VTQTDAANDAGRRITDEVTTSPGVTSADDAPPAVRESVLDDLRDRLRAYRRVVLPPGLGWQRGVDGDYLADLVSYWSDSYDWREHEARLRTLPWALTETSATPIRAIHQRAAEPGAVPVLLLHGWPDSVLRFQKVLPLLTDLHVIVPALPGFPFAAPVSRGGLPTDAMAEAIAAAMAELGYERYVISAGDVGCDVADALAVSYPERVAALHLTDVSQIRFLMDPPHDLSDAERTYVQRGHSWQAAEGGYIHEQSTRPHTLAVGLGDSPAGLAAWLLEKLRAWTDSAGDVETVFKKDELLTWITAYWVTGTIGTSFTPYAEFGPKATGQIQAPTAFTVFPKDVVNAPREFASRFYDVQSWTEYHAGGHFAAWERPLDYTAGIRTAVSFVQRQESRSLQPSPSVQAPGSAR
jgi:pimeloyl-ACP methyl ester carboxylesterase